MIGELPIPARKVMSREENMDHKVMGSNPVNCQSVLVLLQNLHIEHVFMWEIRHKFSQKFLTNDTNLILAKRITP